MSRRRTHRPRSSPAPLRCADGAVDLIEVVSQHPIRAETICLLTDDAYLPVSCIVVEGGGRPDDVFDIVELIAELSLTQPIAHVALSSCRPGVGFDLSDVDRWHELSVTLADHGVELLEWFIRDEVVTVAVTPLAGEPPRWPPSYAAP